MSKTSLFRPTNTTECRDCAIPVLREIYISSLDGRSTDQFVVKRFLVSLVSAKTWDGRSLAQTNQSPIAAIINAAIEKT